MHAGSRKQGSFGTELDATKPLIQQTLTRLKPLYLDTLYLNSSSQTQNTRIKLPIPHMMNCIQKETLWENKNKKCRNRQSPIIHSHGDSLINSIVEMLMSWKRICWPLFGWEVSMITLPTPTDRFIKSLCERVWVYFKSQTIHRGSRSQKCTEHVLYST